MASGRLRPPDRQRGVHASRRAPPPSARRCAASRCRPPPAPARCASTRRASRCPRRCRSARRRGCGSPPSRPTTARPACSSASPTSPSPSTTRRASRIRSASGTPSTFPPPPPGSAVAQWDLGSELLGRPGCADGADAVRCAATMALSPEEPVNLSRTLSVPEATTVTPTVWVRARQGPNLADLIAQPGAARALGDADLIDVLGSAYAASDGDPRTSWTAPQNIVQHRTVGQPDAEAADADARSPALRLTPSSSELPAHPTHGRDRPRRRPAGAHAGSPTARRPSQLHPQRDRHRHDLDPRLARRNRPHRTGFRPGQAARAGRGHRAGPGGHPDRRPRRGAQPDAHGRAAVRQGPDHRRGGTVRPDLGAPPPSAPCSTANPSPPRRARRRRSRCPPASRNW